MYKLTLVLGLLSSAFAAQTTTLLLVGFDDQAIDASVIASDATATTYALSCGKEEDEDEDCGVPPNFTFTQGPSTMHYKYSMQGNSGLDTVEAGCKITSDHGACSITYNVRNTIQEGSESVYQYSEFGKEIGAQAVTIVGAAAAPGAATTTAAQPGQTGAGSSESNTDSNSPTGSTSVSTGGMPMMTGQAQWVIGGAAAAAVVLGAM